LRYAGSRRGRHFARAELRHRGSTALQLFRAKFHPLADAQDASDHGCLLISRQSVQPQGALIVAVLSEVAEGKPALGIGPMHGRPAGDEQHPCLASPNVWMVPRLPMMAQMPHSPRRNERSHAPSAFSSSRCWARSVAASEELSHVLMLLMSVASP